VAKVNHYVVWTTLASFLEGVSVTALGRVEQGLAMTESAIDLYRGLTTPPVFWPQVLMLRGWVHALAGQPELALLLIDEAIQIAGPRDVDAPDFRVFKGDILRMLPAPDLAGAAEAYQAGIRGARTIGLRLIELRGLARLVALHREMGRSPDRCDELASLYATFTEGFDEPDLIVARETMG
jgi:hypothetical protein